VKREITGDIGLIPECDIPLGSECIDIVERYWCCLTQFTGSVYSLCCVFTVYVNYIVLDLHMKTLISTNMFSCVIKNIRDVE